MLRNMKTIFLSFSICDSSVTDYFMALAIKLSTEYKVIIVTDRLEKDNIPDNIKVYLWPGKRGTTLKDFRFLLKKVRCYKPKLMLANFGSVNMFLLVGKLLRVPTRIAWVHTLSTQLNSNKTKKLRKQLVYTLATHLLANSTATKKDVIKVFKVPEKKIKIVYNSVQEYNVNQYPIDQAKLIYVGRMHPSKGVTTLLKGVALLLKEKPWLRLELLGGNFNDPQMIAYQDLTKELDIHNQVHFLGAKSKQEVLEALASAFITIVPSVSEAFGYVVIESFSVKTPVIGSRTSGIAEIIRDGKDGLLFETENEKDLCNKMRILIDDPTLRDKMSKTCYERFLDTFEVHTVTKQLADNLSLLIEEKAKK